MADFFSDHYTATAGGTSIDDPRLKVEPGVGHARLYYKRATLSVTTATSAADVLRFFSLKSGDRIMELLLSHTADASTAVTGNAGAHRTFEDGGAVLDLNLFCAVGTAPMSDLTAAISRTDLLTLAALELEDRGKPLWEQVEEGATQGWTSDPQIDIDITVTIAAETAIVASEYVMECYYTSSGVS